MIPFDKFGMFIWRSWQQSRSYKIAFALQFLGILVPLTGLIFMGRLFNTVDISSISRYGGNYAAFMLVGVVVTSYSGIALRAFSGNLRAAQFTGTLEVLLLTRASLPTIVFGWSLYPFLRATVFMLVYLTGGFLILGLRLDNANVGSAFLALLLTVTVMGSMGIMAASFTLVFKQGDPFTAAIVVASGLLSGTMYPVSILPGWLQAISRILPQTHAIESMRLAVLQGYSVGDLMPQLGALAIYAVLLLPLSLLTFKLAMHRAKIEGSLAHY
jgi:ABC-2 type transport system permease protein